MKPLRLLVAGGGTGGHLFPGIAVAQAVVEAGGEVLFVGTERGIEKRVVPAAGFPLELLKVSGLKRMGFGKTLLGVIRLPAAFWGARAILRRFSPDVVLGVGGYASGPMVMTAALSGVPTAIQEQNSVPGFTNRVLGRVVNTVFVGFDDAGRHFAAHKVVHTGNPVRAAFVSAVASHVPHGNSDPPTLLVVGGSQGARAVNDRMVDAMEILSKRGLAPRLVHQSGAADLESLQSRYASLGLADRVEVRSFIDDMVATYCAADLVVARAGALTLAELAMVQKPAVLIPLPTAADDHQTKNAEAFARAGAAELLTQNDATPERLADAIARLLADPVGLRKMGEAMLTMARPSAVQEIVVRLGALASGQRASGR
ncbi:MAG: undecaprenyldiphospho-muramoylpentapeptide beta-N-acetylglucosaminyltransferase [Deltaproteobacteria bacterium]|nr:undecaprenyldiphospho-muramoylpentapeptide beta-N-acetylglucosaminyltransferase [Deltaproteobacteria bacterium]